MNVAELISLTRESVLDDTDKALGDYGWSDTELIFALNRAYNELHKLPLVTDQTTTAIVQIKLLSNVGAYVYDPRIIQIKDARLSVNSTYGSLIRTTENYLNKTITDWRSLTGTPQSYCPGSAHGYLSIYPKFDDTGEVTGSITFATTKVISKIDGDFSAYAVGDSVNVDGTVKNDGYFTVATAGTTSFTVAEDLVNETHSATLRKVMDTLLLTVDRLPTSRFTTADIANATPITGIREDHQDGLVDGIAKRAYLKPDSQTFDPRKAEHHRVLFEEFKKEVRRDIILLIKPDKSRRPRSGTSIWY